jgi:hypothetical protein
MSSLFAPPVRQIAVAVLLLVAMAAGAYSARLIASALGRARALDLIRGIRVAVIALVSSLTALGISSSESGFVVLGALILGEELYETGVLALIIRLGDRDSPGRHTMTAGAAGTPTARP